VSRDFELGTNVSCKKSTVSPRTGLILNIFKLYGDALDIKFNWLWFEPRLLSVSHSTAHGARVLSPLNYMGTTGALQGKI